MNKLILLLLILGLSALYAQEWRIRDVNGHDYDYFGKSVDIDGTYCIAGVPNENLHATNPEAAFIFHYEGGDWNQQKKLTDPEDDGYDDFGDAVAIYGTTCVVGVPYKHLNNSNEGCVFLFDRDQGGADNWGLAKKIVANDHDLGDQFGSAVALYGDYLVVGSPYDWQDGTHGGGSVYIFERNYGGVNNWGQIKKLRPPSGYEDSSQNFGCSVDVYGDYVIVGAKDYGGHGQAFLFYRNQGGADNWGLVKALIGHDTNAADAFGYSVTVWGDYAAVGANNHEENYAGTDYNCGSVYVFYRNQGGADNWGEVSQLFPLELNVAAQFGNAVSIYNQFLVVGAPRDHDPSGGELGYIYSFQVQADHTWNFVTKHNSNTHVPDRYAYSVAISDVYAISGVPYDNVYEGATDIGSAYVMENASVLGLVEDNSLPVELSSFTAQAGDGQVLLKWTTQSEVNNDAFILERGTDSLHFAFLAEIPGQGNSSSPTNYSYKDRSVINGRTYYYRLGDRDFSGAISYHPVVRVTPNANQDDYEPILPLKLRLFPPYPNPFNPTTTIKYQIPASQFVELSITNLLGKQVKQLYLGTAEQGTYQLRWDGKDNNGRSLPSGIYFVTLKTNTIVTQQKLLLIR